MRDGLAACVRVVSLGALLATSACVTVDVPDGKPAPLLHANPTADASIATFDRSMIYLQDARHRLTTKTRTMEGIDAGTRLIVGIGVAGAGIAASSGASAKTIGPFLTGAAVGFMANRDVAPVAIGEVYRAGLANLTCIRAAGVQAHAGVEALRTEINGNPALVSNVQAAIDQLSSDIGTIKNVDDNQSTATLQLPVQATIDAISAADGALRNLRKFLQASDGDTLTGERVVEGVNATLYVVNKNALARTPNVQEILDSGAVFGHVIGTGAGWITDIQSAKKKLGDALSATQSAITPPAKGLVPAKPTPDGIKEKLSRDQMFLKLALARIPDLSLASEKAMLAQCQTVIATLAPVTVTPNPISATAGGDAVTLTLTGKAPFSAQNLPTGVTFSSFKTSTIKADAKAKADSYTVQFIDSFGISSGDVPLTIKAAAVADAGAGTGAAKDGAAAGKGDAVAGAPPPSPAIPAAGGGAGK